MACSYEYSNLTPYFQQETQYECAEPYVALTTPFVLTMLVETALTAEERGKGDRVIDK